jgi:hypothetical protein
MTAHTWLPGEVMRSAKGLGFLAGPWVFHILHLLFRHWQHKRVNLHSQAQKKRPAEAGLNYAKCLILLRHPGTHTCPEDR